MTLRTYDVSLVHKKIVGYKNTGTVSANNLREAKSNANNKFRDWKIVDVKLR